ncbi:MAG: L,D-transpeptidase [Deltaproteobacteria bacterium]|jgi:hypothetical protein|nr:L,D-transpeptidase [Deltaproteobacteria bacterium]
MKLLKSRVGRITLEFGVALAIILALSLDVFRLNLIDQEIHIKGFTDDGITQSRVASRMFVDDLSADYDSEVAIEINIPATEMRLYENGEELFMRKVAVGQGRYPTPERDSQIELIEWNPWWFPPKSRWARKDKPTPPGPRNPLGPVKLRVGKHSEILLHGTNKSWSVGRAASHGCMRMHNSEAKSIAWYLQEKFSKKNNPDLLDTYRDRSRSTFRVKLEKPIPIKLVYRLIEVRDNNLVFYPDVYKKFHGNKKAVVLTELLSNGYEIDMLDDAKVEALSSNWPSKRSEIPIEELLMDPPSSDFLDAPECS